MESKSPAIFIYSILVPIVWLSLAFSLLAIAPEIELGIAGIIIAVNLSLFILCWHFSRTFKRQFRSSEKIRLCVYSFLWMAAIRALNLYGISDNLTSEVLLYAGGIVLAIDLLVIASSVFSVSNRFNNFWQNRLSAKNA
ncbi:hypothetical protein [Neptunicella sp. SCSIO 80796]|uniref:hypothetical protein n=1 Tax=Neptunicella plasticusilytica TaxID=3117012 RepID=UPI003A4DF46E